MNQQIKEVIKKEINKSKSRMIVTCVLAFFGLLLTWLFLPTKLSDVSILFLIAACFNLGVTCGLFLIAAKLGISKEI